jgi:hypothetical protein
MFHGKLIGDGVIFLLAQPSWSANQYKRQSWWSSTDVSRPKISKSRFFHSLAPPLKKENIRAVMFYLAGI